MRNKFFSIKTNGFTQQKQSKTNFIQLTVLDYGLK